jgi:hypothetical protein
MAFVLLFTIQTLQSQGEYRVLKDTTDSNSIVLKILSIREFEVNSRRLFSTVKSGSAGVSIDVKELKKLPNIMGDADPFKSLQYMGGMSQAGEASANMNIRGGDNDQNLILLNGSAIENPTHVLGLFSVFNPDLIDQIQYIKSGIPAEYGGRLSSVIDIKNFANNPSKIEIDGNIGLIASRLSFKSKLSKNLSVYAAHRLSYLSSLVMPMLIKFGIDPKMAQNNYEFSDSNLGFNLKLSSSTKLSGHFYSGTDLIKLTKNAEFSIDDNSSRWGNRAWGLQLTKLLSEKFSMSHSFNATRFNLLSELNWLTVPYNMNSEKSALNLKSDFLYLADSHKFKVGMDLSAGKLLPLDVKKSISDSLLNPINYKTSTQASLYIRDEWESGPLLLNIGLRAGVYLTHPNSQLRIPLLLSDNKNLESLHSGLEPRIFGRWMLDNESSVKVSVSKHFQYSSRVKLINLGLPLEVFVSASNKIKPSSLWHFSGGYFKSFNQNSWEMSIEAYYKSFSNLIEYTGNMNNPFSDNNIEDKLESGIGYAYGTELSLRKNIGRFSGWLNYSLGWNYRQFESINNGLPFLASQDRRHDLSLIGLYSINEKLSLSATFVYATGSRLNLPRSWYIIDDKVVLEFSEYNSFKMPDYHRLDISLNYQLPNWRKLKSELNFSVYNFYNRANPFQISYSTRSDSGQYDYKIKMSYLIPILPSVSWTFHL